MELTQATVQTLPSLTLPWDETLILPLGDFQHGARGADLDKLKRHVDWAMSFDNAYFVGMGDYVDVASPSNRKALRKADLYDSVNAALEDAAHRALDDVEEVLKPTKGRWLGLLRGHHWWEFEDGGTTDTKLSDALDAPFLESCAIIQVKFSTGHTGITGQIWCHHGEGSGQTMAAPLNKLEKLMSRWPSVDVFLIGHYSRKVGYPVDALVPVFGKNPRLQAKRRILACTGGFMRGYSVGGRPSYVEQGLMPPTNLGGVVVYMRPVHTRDENRLDLNISL